MRGVPTASRSLSLDNAMAPLENLPHEETPLGFASQGGFGFGGILRWAGWCRVASLAGTLSGLGRSFPAFPCGWVGGWDELSPRCCRHGWTVGDRRITYRAHRRAEWEHLESDYEDQCVHGDTLSAGVPAAVNVGQGGESSGRIRTVNRLRLTSSRRSIPPRRERRLRGLYARAMCRANGYGIFAIMALAALRLGDLEL